VHQQYLPDDARDAVYYRPSRHGYEQEIAERMRRLADGAEAADRHRDQGDER
jgi:replication-associated recombination protein RarA